MRYNNTSAHLMRAAALLVLVALYAQPATALTRAEREQAVIDTIQNSDNAIEGSDACGKISFYWEIGDTNEPLAHGRHRNISRPPTRTKHMDIASASKWLYAAYVAEVRGGQLNSDDIAALTHTTGFTEAYRCRPGNDTVGECLRDTLTLDENYDDFVYLPTNAQWHAINEMMGLENQDAAGLADAMLSVLNQGLPADRKIMFTFEDPAPAYGINMNTEDYAQFLQNILGGYYQVRYLLGSHPVLADCPDDLRCTNANSPVAKMLAEHWHYSIGHWVEDDPNGSNPNGDDPGDHYNDGAFSSPGAYGYYPWIAADKSYYGILARRSILLFEPRAAAKSVRCGRKIRRAWMTGVAQPPPGN